jgi:hypothetical protein
MIFDIPPEALFTSTPGKEPRRAGGFAQEAFRAQKLCLPFGGDYDGVCLSVLRSNRVYTICMVWTPYMYSHTLRSSFGPSPNELCEAESQEKAGKDRSELEA